MADKTRVNLVVHPDKKEEWDSTVEESTEYSSLSDLIRQAVSHELADNNQPAQTTDGAASTSEQTQAGLDALEDVTDTLARIESSLSSLDQRVGSLEDEIMASQADTGLQNQLFEVLPTPPGHGPYDRPSLESWAKSVSELAEETTADASEVEDTLTQLMDMTNTVKRDTSDGTTYYYREE